MTVCIPMCICANKEESERSKEQGEKNDYLLNSNAKTWDREAPYKATIINLTLQIKILKVQERSEHYSSSSSY